MSDSIPATGTYDTGDRAPLCRYGSVQMTDVGVNLPITLAEGGAWRTMCRAEIPVNPLDFLDISAWTRVTNNASSPRYNVGITSQLQFRDEDGDEYTDWRNIGSSSGENVTPDSHHLEVGPVMHGFFVPADWVPGHRIVVALQAYAQSSAARSGDVVTADALGEVSAVLWRTPGSGT